MESVHMMSRPATRIWISHLRVSSIHIETGGIEEMFGEFCTGKTQRYRTMAVTCQVIAPALHIEDHCNTYCNDL